MRVHHMHTPQETTQTTERTQIERTRKKKYYVYKGGKKNYTGSWNILQRTINRWRFIFCVHAAHCIDNVVCAFVSTCQVQFYFLVFLFPDATFSKVAACVYTVLCSLTIVRSFVIGKSSHQFYFIKNKIIIRRKKTKSTPKGERRKNFFDGCTQKHESCEKYCYFPIDTVSYEKS